MYWKETKMSFSNSRFVDAYKHFYASLHNEMKDTRFTSEQCQTILFYFNQFYPQRNRLELMTPRSRGAAVAAHPGAPASKPFKTLNVKISLQTFSNDIENKSTFPVG